jgi:hypothetical protein
MASVPLDFIPPDDPNITKLYIYEGASATAAFTLIDTVTAVGAYPNYISQYTTTLAVSPTDWFRIQWENASGARSAMSQPMQGGADLAIGKIIRRVLQRDSSLDENVVSQEAEGAIQMVFGDNTDPYDPMLTMSYREINGLVYLVLARSLIVRSIQQSASIGNVDSATLGLVSFKSGSTTSSSSSVKSDVQDLIDLANGELGLGTSFVMLLDDIDTTQYLTYDHSRLVSGWLSIE